jgi:hypothetical protein
VAHNLTERYKEQWVDPKDDRNTNFAATDWSPRCWNEKHLIYKG